MLICSLCSYLFQPTSTRVCLTAHAPYKPRRLLHLQLYPRHIPGSESSYSLRVLSPPCHQLITSFHICSHHTVTDRVRGCSLSKGSLFLSCCGASTNHHPLLYNFPSIKVTIGHFSSSLTHLLPASTSHNTESSAVQQEDISLFMSRKGCICLKQFHETSTASSRSCKENSGTFINRLGHHMWQQTTYTQE